MSRAMGRVLGRVTIYAPTQGKPYYRLKYTDRDGRVRQTSVGTDLDRALEHAQQLNAELSREAGDVAAEDLETMVSRYFATPVGRRRDKRGRVMRKHNVWQPSQWDNVSSNMRRAIASLPAERRQMAMGDLDSLTIDLMRTACGTYGMVMPKLFEDFLTEALGSALVANGGRCRAQDRWHLDEASSVPMKPDIVWYGPDSTAPTAVIDTKYKAEKPSGYPNADLYQMLAYCTVRDLPRGHLVYAKGTEPEARHRVVGVGVEIHQHALDLDVSPSALLEQVERSRLRSRSSLSRRPRHRAGSPRHSVTRISHRAR